MRTLSAADLQALANSARYAGQATLSLRFLQTLRRRFPATSPARTAAFLMGRVEADLRGRCSAAVRWFSTYLREAPAGPLVEAALGRRMGCYAKTGRRSLALRDARAYLKRYPRGLFAAQARRLVAP